MRIGRNQDGNHVLSNAVKHIPTEETVKVVTYNDAKFLCISVYDAGVGFFPDVLKHATEQFHMGHCSRTAIAHYGMGLYIAKTIVIAHGGELILDNLLDTGGTKVTIKIPYKSS